MTALTSWQAGLLAEAVAAGVFHIHNGLDRAAAQQLTTQCLLRRIGCDVYQVTDEGYRTATATRIPAPAGEPQEAT